MTFKHYLSIGELVNGKIKRVKNASKNELIYLISELNKVQFSDSDIYMNTLYKKFDYIDQLKNDFGVNYRILSNEDIDNVIAEYFLLEGAKNETTSK